VIEHAFITRWSGGLTGEAGGVEIGMEIVMKNLHDYEIDVSPATIDANGHVNNVEYVRWMQDAGIDHFARLGGMGALKKIKGTWVARSTTIKYLKPALLGDRVRVRTWVEESRRVMSTRKYEIIRVSDGVVLARGETDWVLIDVVSGRPMEIPGEIAALFADATE